MSVRVLIAGVSARAAAESAARAGFAVTAVDAFADLDQHAEVRAVAVPGRPGARFTAWGAATAAESMRADAAVYLSPFENDPRAVTRLARDRVLWGNPPGVLRGVRHPEHLADAVRRGGASAPEVLASPPEEASSREWLLKPRASGGGHRIERWRPGTPVPPGCYLQERVEGVPASVVFVAAGGRTVTLGVSQQIVGDAAFGASGYRYCGSLLPPASDPSWGPASPAAARASALGRTIALQFGLVGINGIDLIVCDGLPVPIEVNPRWCSSVELVERASGRSAFAAHALACTAGELPDVSPAAPALAHGKAIVFARHHVRVGDTRPWFGVGSVRDIPRPGTEIEAGGPVCTVFATAPDTTSCYAALVRHADHIYSELSNWSERE